MLAGFGSTFLNFYAINKYPVHFNYSVVHWQTLSILSDFLIVQRVFERKHVSLRLVLFKVCVMILSAGIDLNYITGISIVSFLFSGLFVLVVLAGSGPRESRRDSPLPSIGVDGDLAPGGPGRLPRRWSLIGATATLGAFLYLPLALQLAREATGFPIHLRGHVPMVEPLEDLPPLLSRFLPRAPRFSLGDFPEGLGAGAVGWTLLVSGLCWGSSRRGKGS